MSSSVKFPGSASQDQNTVGTTQFSNPTYIQADDTNYASCVPSGTEASKYSYRLYGYNYGFSIPTGATIQGIVATICGSFTYDSDGSQPTWYGIWIRKADGSFGTTNKKSGNLPNNYATVDIGGTTDLWGETLTPTDINDVDFGVGIQFSSIRSPVGPTYYAGASFDYIKLTVYYSETGINTVNGLVKASVKVVNGLAIASIKGIDGLT